MAQTINFGIDLGTTNSAIAKFAAGEVKVFKNPIGWKHTLPSAVGFRKDRILVGEKAREYMEKDSKSVIGNFKRKMGTSESFKMKGIKESKTPIELSSQVLKELKTFVTTNEELDAAVITIPASFDTIQSNATKEAGHLAGFKQIVLLQEPIAASLAYANMQKQHELPDGQWLVYDLGGGTFDVALVQIKGGEMKVLDHEGDNFLGGSDFDRLLVERTIIPAVNDEYAFDNLEQDLKSASGRLNSIYYRLLHSAENAKITLSTKTSDEIQVEGFEDDNGEEVDLQLTITRSELNDVIREMVDNSISLVKQILTRNSLRPSDIQFTLMVGGSTYIPFVRQRVEEVLQIPINCEIDPTTAVAIGAAYYAGTKIKEIEKASTTVAQSKLSIKCVYERASREKDELFSAKVLGPTDDLFYRITRQDGGFDTGLVKLTERISIDLPLIEGSYSIFNFSVYDSQNNLVETDVAPIEINGGYGISGQPLPEDICLEVDDEDQEGETKLISVFEKNRILPLKRTFTRSLNKTVVKGSTEDVIRINVVEGPHTSLPEANRSIGYFEISGTALSRNVQRGSDIEITIAMTESRDLTISAYLSMADQEFQETFNPTVRHTTVDLVRYEANRLNNKVESEIQEAADREDYETAEALRKLKKDAESLNNETARLTDDDVTDAKYQLEDRKRRLAQAIDLATKNKRLLMVREAYTEERERCRQMVAENGNDFERKHLNDIISSEATFLTSSNVVRVEDKTRELANLRFTIMWRTPTFLIALFNDLASGTSRMNDASQAKSLVESGQLAIQAKNWDRLAEINHGLLNLLPRSIQEDVTTKIGF